MYRQRKKQPTRPIHEQILYEFTNRTVLDGIRLIRQSRFNPNTPVFGIKNEPLLHAIARANRLKGMTTICQLTTANIELTNAAGETPLAIALMVNMPFTCPRVQTIQNKVGGNLNATHIVPLLAKYCVCNNFIDELMELNRAGMKIDPKQIPLMHLFALHCPDEYTGIQLLDTLWQDPFERNAKGRTLMESPRSISIHLMQQLRDATEGSPIHNMAVMMGVHNRLGANSPLQDLPAELIRDFILPHVERHMNINEVRTERLKALTANENVTISNSLKKRYVDQGRGDVTFADFRRAHFMHAFRQMLPTELKNTFQTSDRILSLYLNYMEFSFNEPYTVEYAKRARDALVAHLTF